MVILKIGFSQFSRTIDFVCVGLKMSIYDFPNCFCKIWLIVCGFWIFGQLSLCSDNDLIKCSLTMCLTRGHVEEGFCLFKYADRCHQGKLLQPRKAKKSFCASSSGNYQISLNTQPLILEAQVLLCLPQHPPDTWECRYTILKTTMGLGWLICGCYFLIKNSFPSSFKYSLDSYVASKIPAFQWR